MNLALIKAAPSLIQAVMKGETGRSLADLRRRDRSLTSSAAIPPSSYGGPSLFARPNPDHVG
jgi:hypothetical protein